MVFFLLLFFTSCCLYQLLLILLTTLYQLLFSQIRVTFSEDILITPPPEPYTCWADATSPPPSQARDFTLLSLTVHSPNSFTANFEWRAPETANGVLDGYSLCVSSEPLALDQDVPVSGGPVVQCSELEVGVRSQGPTGGGGGGSRHPPLFDQAFRHKFLVLYIY